MKFGVFGTGMVGHAIATRLVALDHDVMMGSRTASNDKAQAWATTAKARGRSGTFADAAAFGTILFNCTRGVSSIDALRTAGASNLDGKILVDVANVLPQATSEPESLGQQIQQAFPGARVVKTLNTVNCDVMVAPGSVPGTHTVFLSGNDASAKGDVRTLLETFGWRDIIDLGDITTARATEGYLALWLCVWKSIGTAAFNIAVARKG